MLMCNEFTRVESYLCRVLHYVIYLWVIPCLTIYCTRIHGTILLMVQN